MARFSAWNSIGRPRSACFLAIAGPILLAGILPLRQETSDRWGWSGSWIYPVGDPRNALAPAAPGAPPYHLARGMGEGEEGGAVHQGADLSNYEAGGRVRAAGNGLVVVARGTGWNRGFGSHVVLAHRTPDGDVFYSVYAHLAAGSVTVHAGQFVGAGAALGRVGMSGRATAPHLHFEVRRAGDPGERWEHASPIDPLAFVGARLPAPKADSLWARPYLEWAECASLIRGEEDADHPPSRAEWWRALAAARPKSVATLPADTDSLRAALVAAGLLSSQPTGDPLAPLEWSELARDLGRARALGLQLPVSPIGLSARRGQCRSRLGVDSPAHDPGALAQGHTGRPSRAAVCLALADLAGDGPRHARQARAKRRSEPSLPGKLPRAASSAAPEPSTSLSKR